MTGLLRPHDQSSLRSLPSDFHLHSGKNVYQLLAQREIAPRTKCVPKRRWGETSKCDAGSSTGICSEPVRDAKRGLISWVEAESLHHLSAKYCPLFPPPRSTIAAAFSSDGKTLASTHGDHTVKIIDCQTGNCLKVLSGHRRTPWVVRFHPLRSEILASGSLDHDVRLWNAKTSECIGFRDFTRPIASIAFHAGGELLAVASGHKLYVWHYNNRGEDSSPTIVLRTRRSLRAVHFHPHGAPFLLTAEVNDLDSSDSSMTRATSPGYLRYPPPAIFVTNVQTNDHSPELPLVSLPYIFMPSFAMDDSRIGQFANTNTASSSVQPVFQSIANVREQHSRTLSPLVAVIPVPSAETSSGSDNLATNASAAETRVRVSETSADAMDVDDSQHLRRSRVGAATNRNTDLSGTRSDFLDLGQFQQFVPLRDRASWELPFLQGWLMAQSQAGIPSMVPLSGSVHERAAPFIGSSSTPYVSTASLETAVASLEIPSNINLIGVSGRSSSRDQGSHSRFSVPESGEAAASNTPHDGSDTQIIVNRIQSELATSMAAAAAAAELPCTVKLRVWSHDIKKPCATLSTEKCRLTIPHAVLCSEMGAHFSPCGRFLAACVACVLPHTEGDSGMNTLVHQDPGLATSPTRHPVAAHQVMYELRIYSLEEATFGTVLVSRAIRAAHCLTSIQFSPTSEHILLAYGRRHGSLLKSIVIDGETTSPIYTVLEVYRVSDMELVRVLPSAEDEVNVACFHPSPGGGLVYGTKEGKLRVFRYNGAYSSNLTAPTHFPDENLAEVQTYALEC